MRLIYFTLVVGLVLAMTGVSYAQMDQMQMDQSMSDQSMTTTTSTMTSFNATVQRGPILMQGAPASADVFVNGRLAIRVAAPAGGMSTMTRAQDIANRLNAAFASGLTWSDTRVADINNNWAVTMGNNVIATATANDACVLGTSESALVNRWARQTVVALGGTPSTIASQITPSMVAGSRQAYGTRPTTRPGMVGAGAMMWSTTPTKTVPLLDAATGNTLGSVTVGGSMTQLNMVNSVVAYQTMSGNAMVWTFVPVTSTSTTGTLTRVNGVGLVSVPTSLINTSMLMTGNTVMTSVTTNATRWNSMINTSYARNNLRIQGNTKVVPLYSTDMNQVIGAVQIVGNPRDVANTQAVMVNTSGGMYMFRATNAACAMPMSGTPTTMNGVVISALILMPSAGAVPGTTGAGMAPSTTTPTAPGTSGAAGTYDDTGTTGTENVPPAPPESGTVTP